MTTDSALFPLAGKAKTGYDRAQVDAFFNRARDIYEGRSNERIVPADIQTATFDLVRGGYDTAEVDAALERLEAAFIARMRVAYVNTYGQDAWYQMLADRARTLYPRLGRQAGQRFAPPAPGQQGYDIRQVDALCDRLIDYFDNDGPLRSAEIRTATFKLAKGNNAYAEAPVDAFLARAAEIMLGVE